jgi:hypothetical protein
MLHFKGPPTTLVIVADKFGTLYALKTSKVLIETFAVFLEDWKMSTTCSGP